MRRSSLSITLLLSVVVGHAAACSLLFDGGDNGASLDAGNGADGSVTDDAGAGIDASMTQCSLPSNVGAMGRSGTADLTLLVDETLEIDTKDNSMQLKQAGRMLPPSWTDALTVRSMPTDDGTHPVSLLSLKELSIPNGAFLRVIGPQALVIVVDGDVDISGTLDISSKAGLGGNAESTRGAGSFEGGVAGPGQSCGFCCSGRMCAPAKMGVVGQGGFGGSFRGLGGVVGAAFDPAQTYGVDETLVPLVGGGGGGGSTTSAGGHGGGAMQISATGQIVVSGSILAGGSGGYGGISGTGQRGGGGGGAGGAILLEANLVQIGAMAKLVVHGGAGGSGNISGAAGSHGMTGPPDPMGTGPNTLPTGHEPGGAGSGSSDDGDGGDGTVGSTANGGGGAGGGAGRIRINHSGSEISKVDTAFFPLASFSENKNWCNEN